MSNAQKIISKYPIISDQIDSEELLVILNELERCLQNQVPGTVVEMGCYIGTTSLFIQRLLMITDKRKFNVYDSFEGLPEKSKHDESPAGIDFKPGSLIATKLQFINNFKKAGLPLPIIRKAWFKDLSPSLLPDSVAFAFLDSDFYDSIYTSLDLIWPKLSPGSTVIVDDYHNEALPGAGRAVDDWLKNHKHKHLRIQSSLAIIYL